MSDEPKAVRERSARDEDVFVDLIPDELSLARAQLASGLPGVAEGVLRRYVARLETAGRGALDELDVAKGLLAEALWRQGRPLGAGAVAQSIRSGSLERRRPMTLLIEAEAMAAAGDPDRGVALMERVIEAVGVDEAWRLRSGVASRLAWPVPASLRPSQRRNQPGAAQQPSPFRVGEAPPERTAAAHARLEASRNAYGRGSLDEGDRELGLAMRLDPRIAPAGIDLVEPTLEGQSSPARLILYGDLLRAAGRTAEASDAYDRAARS